LDIVTVIRALAVGLPAGFIAGTFVTLVARTLPERGRLFGRPVCAGQGCGLNWTASSPSLRKVGLARSCPTCGADPSMSDVVLELGTMVIVAALAVRWSIGPMLAAHLVFAALLMTILAIDLRHRQVYLVLGYGGVVLALLLSPVSLSGGPVSAAIGGMIGGLAFGGLYALGRAIYRGGEPLGTGDITIATLLGVMAGFPGILTALLVGIMAGGVGAVAVLLAGRSRKAFMPYGPALCLGGLWVLFST
jgi:prepilin signal peptidase PulO-like enzyme (type II secretory pathway)